MHIRGLYTLLGNFVKENGDFKLGYKEERGFMCMGV